MFDLKILRHLFGSLISNFFIWWIKRCNNGINQNNGKCYEWYHHKLPLNLFSSQLQSIIFCGLICYILLVIVGVYVKKLMRCVGKSCCTYK